MGYVNGTIALVWKHVICAQNVGAGTACEYVDIKIKWRNETEVHLKVLHIVLQAFEKALVLS